MNQQNPIGPNAEICEVLTCLPERMVVDFANNLTVAKDHIREQKKPSGLFKRLLGTVSGKNQRRQIEVNASLTESVDASLQWLTKLTDSVAQSTHTLSLVQKRVSTLTENTAAIVNYSADTRDMLAHLETRLSGQLNSLEEKVDLIDCKQAAQLNLERVIARWEAGGFNCFSLAGRSYVALEELYWGPFGDLCRQLPINEHQPFLDDLKNRVQIQLAKDAKLDQTKRLSLEDWQRWPEQSPADARDAITWLADQATPERSPMTVAICQQPEKLPGTVPLRCSAKRITDALVPEVFGAHRYE
ncbi:MAG: hypothetical protein KC477_06050 [Oceanospirillaceae bacterium]|nr:hypothetical protein [Oceanospirillaceae bacterium]